MAVAAWLLDLGRNVPGFVRARLPVGPLDGRTRERVLLAVAESDGGRWSVWVHDGWIAFLGEGVDEPTDAEDALLDYARACAAADRPIDTGALAAAVPPAAVATARAVVAEAALTAAVGRRIDGIARRLRHLDVLGAAVEAATVAVAAPVVAPVLATAGAMHAVARLAPPLPDVDAPDDDDANLLAHLLARTVPAYLANALVRLAVLRLPVPLTIGVRTGRSEATVRIDRGRVAVTNGIAGDAVVVLEGDVEPLVHVAAGSLVRELTALRLRRE